MPPSFCKLRFFWTFVVFTLTLPSTGRLEASQYAGIRTNGPAVFTLTFDGVTNTTPNPIFARNKRLLASTNPLPPMVLRYLRTASVPEFETNFGFVTNSTFLHFVPGSLNYLLWTNFIAHTNGRSTVIWSTRTHPPGWPAVPPQVAWNHQSLLWGMKGLTALSPCWENEGSSGQVPITALTRRHGYTRGHGMGADGFREHYAGRQVWFVTAEDKIVDVRVRREVVRTQNGRDYTIVLFDRDLPASISPIRVISATNMMARYVYRRGAPWPLFATEQGGNVSAAVPGFDVATYKGGDSGSPNMLPFLDELVFHSGRSTSGPSREMQEDMDELCRRERLDPRRYQMQWLDLSNYPAYPPDR